MANDKETSSHDKIEIRSEKVRHILGEAPNRFLQWGIVLICMIFAVLIAFVLSLKYPYGSGETILEHILMTL